MKTIEDLEANASKLSPNFITTVHGNYVTVRKIPGHNKDPYFCYEYSTSDHINVDITREQAQYIITNFQLKER